MIEKLNSIKLGDKVFPFKCDNLVLEELQDEFGTLDDFEKKLNGWIPVLDENGIQRKNDKGEGLFKVVEPSMKAINFSLTRMIREGVEIANETAEEKISLPSDKEILRLVEQPLPVSKEIYAEYLNCFKVKNAKATQGKRQKKDG